MTSACVFFEQTSYVYNIEKYHLHLVFLELRVLKLMNCNCCDYNFTF